MKHTLGSLGHILEGWPTTRPLCWEVRKTFKRMQINGDGEYREKGGEMLSFLEPLPDGGSGES